MLRADANVSSRSRFVVACSAMGLLLAATGERPASADGDRDAGLRLAQHWCAGCHGLEDTQSATDAAPSFPDIARAHGQDRRWLTAWLMAPHLQMPDFNLSRQEIDDIIAYLSSLPEQDE